MCCIGKNPDEACGWPPKTIRAIIAIILVLSVFPSSIFLMVFLILKQQYDSAIAVSASMMGIIGTVIGYYFGTRASESKNKLASDIENRYIDHLSILNRQINQPLSYEHN